MTGSDRSPQASSVAKRLVVGRAFPSYRLEHTLLPKALALPVFASDPLSSVAYATEESMAVLLAVSATSLSLITPISISIAALLAIVVASYRQTVRAYPNGGGAYIVSRENLGELPGLVAASALLVDYMMTVVVSVVAGVYAITSAAPSLVPYRVELSIAFVFLVTFANLRGQRESGTLFAIPTYGFVATIGVMILVGLAKCATSCPTTAHVEPAPAVTTAVGAVSLYVILRAFASGATALTGVEAISNGVQAFRRPSARNAATTLLAMGVMSISMYLGISWLAVHIGGVTFSEERTVVAQIANAVFGGGLGFFVVQIFTAAILVLAANTAFQDFPRLSSILARDGYMPRQFLNRGDRLVFSNGIVGLALLSSAVIWIFDAELTRLIQLYIVGVFTSFTLSQTGMVRHWMAERRRGADAAKGWQRSVVINVIGAITTFVVLIVVTATKFTHGAWLSILAMALLVPTLLSIHRHYAWIRDAVHRGAERIGTSGQVHVVVLVREVDAATAEALGYIRSFHPRSIRAITPAAAVPEELASAWAVIAGGGSPPLEPVGKGSITSTVRRFIRSMELGPHDVVNLVVPEEVSSRLASYVLHTGPLVRLKAALLREPHIVITDVPVVITDDGPRGVDAKPLIPQRTITLVFISSVNDLTIRAVNFARSLDATMTRAIYFDLDPEEAHRLESAWFDAGFDIPLDIVEAPFRDLTGPMLEEVRRYSSDPDTVVNVIVPEVIVSHWWQLPLHNQNALFIKRLFLYEDRVVLTSVPMLVRGTPQSETETV
jgi:amino acid transporter